MNLFVGGMPWLWPMRHQGVAPDGSRRARGRPRGEQVRSHDTSEPKPSSVQEITPPSHRGAPQLMKPCPGRLITAQAENALHPQRTDPVLLVRRVPHRLEPRLASLGIGITAPRFYEAPGRRPARNADRTEQSPRLTRFASPRYLEQGHAPVGGFE